MRCFQFCHAFCPWPTSLASSRSSPKVTFQDQAEVRAEPEKEPDEEEEAPVSVKDRLLQRLTRMNTQDLLQKIRRNISSFSVIDSEDLSWDWEDISTEPDIAFAVMELKESACPPARSAQSEQALLEPRRSFFMPTRSRSSRSLIRRVTSLHFGLARCAKVGFPSSVIRVRGSPWWLSPPRRTTSSAWLCAAMARTYGRPRLSARAVV